jgi:hypothetical protein
MTETLDILLDAEARQHCHYLDYKNNSFGSFTGEERFIEYGTHKFFIPMHNGACVYECYGKMLDLSWFQICESIIANDYNHIVNGKFTLLLSKNAVIICMCVCLYDVYILCIFFNASELKPYVPDKQTEKIFDCLVKARTDGLLSETNTKNRLPRGAYANYDLDLYLSKIFDVAFAVLMPCSNGGGLCLMSYAGLQNYAKCKYLPIHCFEVLFCYFYIMYLSI